MVISLQRIKDASPQPERVFGASNKEIRRGLEPYKWTLTGHRQARRQAGTQARGKGLRAGLSWAPPRGLSLVTQECGAAGSVFCFVDLTASKPFVQNALRFVVCGPRRT